MLAVNIRAALFLFFIFGPISWAHSYELFPEYRSIESYEPFKDFKINRIDSEYQSDYLTYLNRVEDDWFWLIKGNQFQGSVGSLSSRVFMNRHRFKIDAPVTDQFDFKVIYFEERDFESDAEHLIFEMVIWNKTKKHGVAVYSEPVSKKEELEAGIAYIYQPENLKSWRLFITRPDYQRNKRTLGTDEFKNTPIAYGLLYQEASASGELKRFYLRSENKVEWCFPDNEFCFEYDKFVVGLSRRKYLDQSYFLNLRGEWSETKTSRSAEGTSVYSSYTRELKKGLFDINASKNKVTVGLSLVHRDWLSRQSNDGRVRQTIYQPYIYKTIPNKTIQSGSGAGFWEFGYEFSSADMNGELAGLERASSRTDHRLNISKIWEFNNHSEIRAVFTFDLDELDSGEMWEGGNVRVLIDI